MAPGGCRYVSGVSSTGGDGVKDPQDIVEYRFCITGISSTKRLLYRDNDRRIG